VRKLTKPLIRSALIELLATARKDKWLTIDMATHVDVEGHRMTLGTLIDHLLSPPDAAMDRTERDVLMYLSSSIFAKTDHVVTFFAAQQGRFVGTPEFKEVKTRVQDALSVLLDKMLIRRRASGMWQMTEIGKKAVDRLRSLEGRE
jgi:hypothetical protein